MAFQNAATIFRGKVVEVQEGPRERKAKVEVVRVWKGQLASPAEVTTPLSTATCGIPFKKDREYVFFARGRDKLTTNSCSQTDSVDSPVGGGAITWLDVNHPPKSGK